MMKYYIGLFIISTLVLLSCDKINVDDSIEEYPPINIDTTFCEQATVVFVNDTVTLTANISGGESPYSYEWSNGETNATIMPLDSGLFALTITDAIGCTTVGSVYWEYTVDVCEGFDIEIVSTMDSMSIYNLSVTIFDGTPPYYYTWFDSTHLETNVVYNEGLYYLKVVDDEGCHAEDIIEIE